MKNGRLLFISYSYLDGHGGGIYATRAYINAFAKLFDVTLLYPTEKGAFPQCIDDSVEKIAVPDNSCKIKKIIKYICGDVHRFVNIPEALISRNKFDYVVFNNSTCSFRLLDKFIDAGIKVITIHHNFQIEYIKADCPFLLKHVTLFWTKRFEGNAARKSDLNLVLTNQDAQLIKDYYHSQKPFEVLGVFEYVKSKVAQVNDMNENSGKCFVITGGLSDVQTSDSIMKWVKEYYPLLKDKCTDAHVIIAGKNPSQSLTDYVTQSGIELIPSPKDMQPILDKADYYICPIDCGGGLKLRNMDGLKNGLKVLTHEVSARGYENLQEQKCLFAYKDKDSFSAALDSMMRTKITRQEIIDAYNSVFSFEAGVMRLNNIIDKSFDK